MHRAAAFVIVMIVGLTTASGELDTQEITFDQPASPQTYGATFEVTATSSSGLTVTISASDGCTISDGTVTITSGTTACVLTASQAGDDGFYAADDVVRTVETIKASQTIDFDQPVTPQTFGSTFEVSASSDSDLDVTISASGGCTIASGTVTVTSGTTDCVLTASQAGDDDYSAAASVERTVVVTTSAAPTVSMRLQAASDSGTVDNDRLTSASSLVYEVTFSPEVTGLSASDFFLDGTVTKCRIQSPVGSGSSYTVTVSGCSEGTIILALAAGSVAAADGTEGPAEATMADAVTIDRTAPAVVSFALSTSPSTFTLQFDSLVNDLTPSDFSFTGNGARSCTVASIVPIDEGSTYTVVVFGCASGSRPTVNLKARTVFDLAGNSGPTKTESVAFRP
jgi:hypothetical protein